AVGAGRGGHSRSGFTTSRRLLAAGGVGALLRRTARPAQEAPLPLDTGCLAQDRYPEGGAPQDREAAGLGRVGIRHTARRCPMTIESPTPGIHPPQGNSPASETPRGVLDWIDWVLNRITAIAMLAVMGIIVCDVIGRY